MEQRRLTGETQDISPRSRFRNALLAVAVMTLVVLPATARGNAFGDPWNESNFQRYWYEPASFGSDWISKMNQIRTNQINPTHMWTQSVPSHTNSDVAAYMRNITDEFVGETSCIDRSGDLCLHWHVTFNTDFNPFSSSQRLHIACHEFGHTLGLEHYADSSTTNSCMKVPANHVFSTHDLFHIDGYYPNNPTG